jgi:hypothetical protein
VEYQKGGFLVQYKLTSKNVVPGGGPYRELKVARVKKDDVQYVSTLEFDEASPNVSEMECSVTPDNNGASRSMTLGEVKKLGEDSKTFKLKY